MRFLAGLFAGVVLGVIGFAESCPDCAPPGCAQATAPLPLIGPGHRAEAPPRAARPRPRRRPRRRSPEIRPQSRPCRTPGLGCLLRRLGAGRARSDPEAARKRGFNSFLEDLSDNP